MMTQITASDLGAPHVGYIVSTPTAVGMLQAILSYTDDSGVIGIVIAGYPNVIPLDEGDPVVVSGLSDIAVDPAEVEVQTPKTPFSPPDVGSVEEAMSTYNKIDVQYRVVDETGDMKFWNRSLDKIKAFMEDNPGFLLERQIKVSRGFVGDEWSRV